MGALLAYFGRHQRRNLLETQTGIESLRAMWGVVMHERANGVKIVCVGRFTPLVIDFARGKAIELIDGDRLLELVREVQMVSPTKAATPTKIVAPAIHAESPADRLKPPLEKAAPVCTKCSSTMIKRFNKTTQDLFWGCSTFPKCRGTKEYFGQLDHIRIRWRDQARDHPMPTIMRRRFDRASIESLRVYAPSPGAPSA